MAAAAIVIDQAGKPAGVAGRSREDLDLLVAVTLSNGDNTGVRTWRWSLVTKPPSSSAILSVTTGPASSFVPDVEGSYLLELMVNGGLAGERSRLIAAVLDGNGFRFPALREGAEFNADGNENGYGPALDEILRGVSTTRTIADWKESCRLATAAVLPANSAAGGPGAGKRLIGNANGALSVDGVAVAVADRILVKNEVTAANNGIYAVTQTGDGSNPYILTRALDFDDDTEVTNGATTSVAAGTANAATQWVLTTLDPITVDVTAQVWSQLTAALPDHGSLPGLGDDDHTQYVLANATRAISSASTGLRIDDGNAITHNSTRTRLASGRGYTTGVASITNPTGGELDQETIVGSNVAQTSVGQKLMVVDGSRNSRAEFFLADDVTGSGAWGHAINWGTNGNQPYRIYSAANIWLEISTAGVLSTWHHVPAADSTYDLGTTTVRWRVGYFDDLNVDANLTFNGAASAILLGSATVAGNAQVRFNKGDAANQSFIQLNMAGAAQWIWQHDTSENCNWLDAAAALVLRLRRSDSNLESRGIRPIADSAHDLGTTSVRWAVVYADSVDVGAADGSPVVNLNKTATGTAFVRFRQAVGADTNGDVRVGLDANERFSIDRRVSGSYVPLIWHDTGAYGVRVVDNFVVGDVVGSTNYTVRIATGDTPVGGRVAFVSGEEGEQVQYAYWDLDGAEFIWGLSGDGESAAADLLRLDGSSNTLYPHSNFGLSLGQDDRRFAYLFHGTPAPEVEAALDNETYNLAERGYVIVSPLTGAVNLNLPASTAANRGKQWLIALTSIANQVDLIAAGSDTIGFGGGTTVRLSTNGVGLYFVTCLGDGNTYCFGPLENAPTLT